MILEYWLVPYHKLLLDCHSIFTVRNCSSGFSIRGKRDWDVSLEISLINFLTKCGALFESWSPLIANFCLYAILKNEHSPFLVLNPFTNWVSQFDEAICMALSSQALIFIVYVLDLLNWGEYFCRDWPFKSFFLVTVGRREENVFFFCCCCKSRVLGVVINPIDDTRACIRRIVVVWMALVDLWAAFKYLNIWNWVSYSSLQFWIFFLG